jgi:hypothetical protein
MLEALNNALAYLPNIPKSLENMPLGCTIYPQVLGYYALGLWTRLHEGLLGVV